MCPDAEISTPDVAPSFVDINMTNHGNEAALSSAITSFERARDELEQELTNSSFDVNAADRSRAEQVRLVIALVARVQELCHGVGALATATSWTALPPLLRATAGHVAELILLSKDAKHFYLLKYGSLQQMNKIDSDILTLRPDLKAEIAARSSTIQIANGDAQKKSGLSKKEFAESSKITHRQHKAGMRLLDYRFLSALTHPDMMILLQRHLTKGPNGEYSLRAYEPWDLDFVTNALNGATSYLYACIAATKSMKVPQA
jgi:hypothetical protein